MRRCASWRRSRAGSWWPGRFWRTRRSSPSRRRQGRAWTRYGRCFAILPRASRDAIRAAARGCRWIASSRSKASGPIATGTLVSGRLREGQNLAVLPRALFASARGIQVHGHHQPAADAGHRVAVNLGGIELADLERGATLCEPGSLEPTRRFDVIDRTAAGCKAASPRRARAVSSRHQ